MGAHDNEEIIDLTDVVEDPVSSQSPSQKTEDFPPEQAIDPKDLEDEFEQLLQGSASSSNTGNGGAVDDDLDIESLFDELEQSPDAARSLGLEDEEGEKKPSAPFSENSNKEDLSDIEDIFASINEDTTDGSSFDRDQELEDLFSEDPTSSQPETDDFMVEEESTQPESDSGQSAAEDLAPEDSESLSSDQTAEEEHPLTPDEESTAATFPEAPFQDANDTQTALQETRSPDEDAFETTLQEAESPDEEGTEASLQERESSDDPAKAPGEPSVAAGTDVADDVPVSPPVDQPRSEELLERIAALEARVQQPPDQEAMFALVSAFFQDNEYGANVLDELTGKVTTRIQETAKHLVEEKFDALDVPSSEEIAAMVKEEIRASVAENMDAAPDTQAIVREIREDLQKKVREGMDAWEADRIALRTDIDGLRKNQLDKQDLVREIREDLQRQVQEGMDAWEAQRLDLQEKIDRLQTADAERPDIEAVIKERDKHLEHKIQENVAVRGTQLSDLRADIEALQEKQRDTKSVLNEIREDLRKKVQDSWEAWEGERLILEKNISALRKDHTDKQDLVREIREDLQHRVQEGMEAWEAQRISLNQQIGELKDSMNQASSRKQARIDELAASMISRKDLEAIQDNLQATISKEIPGAAARIIREEIAALMK